MIKTITVEGQFISELSLQNIEMSVVLEYFSIPRGWIKYAELPFDKNGVFSQKINPEAFTKLTSFPAMQLRIVHPQLDTKNAILLTSPVISIKEETSFLLNFGTIFIDVKRPLELLSPAYEKADTAFYGSIIKESKGGDSGEIGSSSDLENSLRKKVSELNVAKISLEEELSLVRKSAKVAIDAKELGDVQVKKLQSDLEILQGGTEAPKINDIANEISQAIQIDSVNTGYKISTANVKLKGYMANGGRSFRALDAVELARVNPETASEISFTLSNTNNDSSSSQKAPDIVGLTPATASRVLLPLGLKLRVIEMEQSTSPTGGIFMQKPDPGTEILLGENFISAFVAVKRGGQKI
ncbi:PASTA domain-containing protein [Vibrio sp. 1-Bac 57]